MRVARDRTTGGGRKPVSRTENGKKAAPLPRLRIPFLTEQGIGVFHGDGADARFRCKDPFGGELTAIGIDPFYNVLFDPPVQLQIRGCRRATVNDIVHLVICNSPDLVIFT